MIGYLTIGVSDLPTSERFYAEVLQPLGFEVQWRRDRFVVFGKDGAETLFSIASPFDEKPPSAGNGAMTAFAARDDAQVSEIHALALKLGAQDEGAPGERPAVAPFFAAYFRDPDGNKIAIFHMERPATQ